MELIIGTGKTHKLMAKAAAHWLYIVCLNRDEVARVAEEAKKLNLEIPRPLSFDEFKRGNFSTFGVRGFLIDNADLLLQSMCQGVPLEGISLTQEAEKDAETDTQA